MGLPVVAGGRLAGRRNEPLAVLPGRLGEELLDPQAESVRIREADLVAPLAPAGAEGEAELEPGVPLVEPAGLRHLERAREQPLEVDPEQRGGDEPERGQRRVAAADRRLAREDRPEPAPAGELLQGRAGIGDRDPLLAVRRALPEEVHVRAGLEGRPRLRRGDEQRPPEVEAIEERADCARVRGVEHVQPLAAEGAAEHLGRKRRPAHPEQHHLVEPPVDVVGQREEEVQVLAAPRRLVEPAEPARLVFRRPDRRVARPDPLDELATVRGHVARAAATAPRFARIPSSSASNESANRRTPSSSSTSTTSS